MMLKKYFGYALMSWFMFLDAILKILVLMGCKLKEIIIGKSCRFVGYPFFSPSNRGGIIIGDKCTFRSREISNMMGINHRCIVNTSDAAGNNPIIKIGDNCGFLGVSIWCFKSITIGNNVRVGANSMIVDGDAHFNDPRTSAPESIVIEDNVFIGAYCIIRKGVTIGKNSVIGMRSMVLHDIPANCIAVGNPAKVIKEINV